MKIVGLDHSILHVPYRNPIQWGARAGEGDDYLFLRLRTDDGVDGWAEAQETPLWSGSTARILAQTLHEIYEPLLVGQDPTRPEQLWSALNRIKGWSTAKALIEVALCEIRAKQAGLPCWKFLGGWNPKVPVSWLINLGPIETRLQDVHEAVERHGFQATKVKIGRNPAEDVELVRQIRSSFGPGMRIFVDANSQYTWEEAMWVSERIAEFDVSLFEDPCPLYPNERTRILFNRSPVPVMADRVVDSVEGAEQYMGLGAAALDLKVAHMGYRESRLVVEAAAEQGVSCVVGTSSETGLRTLVSLHFRASMQHLDNFPAENSFFLKLPEDFLEEPLVFVDGSIELSDAPGFGTAPSQAAMDKYRVG
jgi:L-alanine-DL-glutamate epimerase-like enolase superfamily enzyme